MTNGAGAATTGAGAATSGAGAATTGAGAATSGAATGAMLGLAEARATAARKIVWKDTIFLLVSYRLATILLKIIK